MKVRRYRRFDEMQIFRNNTPLTNRYKGKYSRSEMNIRSEIVVTN